jgi:hypothetical protein
MDEVKKLIEQLKDLDHSVRTNAALQLGVMRDPIAIPALIEAADDKDETVSAIAADSLGELAIRDTSLVRPVVLALLQLFGSRNEDIPFHAEHSLEKITDILMSSEEINDFEDALKGGFDELSRKRHRKNGTMDIRIQIARFRSIVAKRRNELSKDKGILLDDKPKPPKGNKGMYQQARRALNG